MSCLRQYPCPRTISPLFASIFPSTSSTQCPGPLFWGLRGSADDSGWDLKALDHYWLEICFLDHYWLEIWSFTEIGWYDDLSGTVQGSGWDCTEDETIKFEGYCHTCSNFFYHFTIYCVQVLNNFIKALGKMSLTFFVQVQTMGCGTWCLPTATGSNRRSAKDPNHLSLSLLHWAT